MTLCFKSLFPFPA